MGGRRHPRRHPTLLSIMYGVVCTLLRLLLVRWRWLTTEEVELLVLRHERRRQRRTSGSVWLPDDRLWFAVLSRCLPPGRWHRLPVDPATLRRWHRELLQRRRAATAAGERLYATEALPGPDVAVPGWPPEACAEANYGEAFEGARAWRVWDLDAATLAPEAEHAVPYPPRALAATPDGGDAFVLAGRATLLRLAPAGGPAVPFATLPDAAFGLAATDDRVFTLDVFGDRLWSLDRARGRSLRSIPTGRSPLGLALAAAGRS